MGYRAYVVCPLIEDNEDGEAELRSVEKFAKELSDTAFYGKRVELLHGKLKQKEKDAVMRRFVSGETSAIVSTTVIEVGVNVPEATVMAIENAERFGLSQLHQLRGRVGRGNAKSYCLLFSNVKKTSTAAERLQALRETNDGFKISEEDLRLRGPGDFFGTRQHGLPEFKIANIYEDTDILVASGQAAEYVMKNGKDMSPDDRKMIKTGLNKIFEKMDTVNFN